MLSNKEKEDKICETRKRSWKLTEREESQRRALTLRCFAMESAARSFSPSPKADLRHIFFHLHRWFYEIVDLRSRSTRRRHTRYTQCCRRRRRLKAIRQQSHILLADRTKASISPSRTEPRRTQMLPFEIARSGESTSLRVRGCKAPYVGKEKLNFITLDKINDEIVLISYNRSLSKALDEANNT